MSKQIKKRYRYKISSVAMFASDLVLVMRRDAVEFAEKGIDSAVIDAFKLKADELLGTLDDTYYRADISVAVEEKNEMRSELESQLRIIVSIAKIKWGVGSAQYNRFEAGEMTKEIDSNFLTTCRMVHQTGTDYLSELSVYGLTQAMLDSFAAKSDAFEQKLSDITAIKEQRILKTAERIEKANELYVLASHYCTVGKIIWQDVSWAKYNDYLIYKYMGRKKKRKKKKDSE